MTERTKPAKGYTVRLLPYSDNNEGRHWLAEKDTPGRWEPQRFFTKEDAVAWTHEAKFHERGVTGT